MTDAPQYTGWVERGSTHGTVVGFIVDRFGWRIELTGTLNPVTRGYVLEGRLGATPAALHIEAIDGPRAEEAAG
jgi:hypothetical protein